MMDFSENYLNDNQSYVYGLLITDGNLYLCDRNRGRVSLEINHDDKDIVYKLYDIIPNSKISNRIRSTNFSKDYHSIRFQNNHLFFREWLIKCGYPTKDKTLNASPPVLKYDESSFWRGVFDGDGSVGITGGNSPFMSLTTKSECLKDAFLKYLRDTLDISKNVNRNTRDSIYNINILNEDAVELSKILYSDSSLHIDRKYNNSKILWGWERTVPKAPKRKPWTKKEDEYILLHTTSDSMVKLDRTRKSIDKRKRILKNKL